MADRRDIYDRRPTSNSRGKTISRILAHQHAAGTIPGTEEMLDERPDGSIAAVVVAFHAEWVESKPVTTRRAYERSIALFVRDLAINGPALRDPIARLDRDRIVDHLDWRVANGLHDPGELQRASLHLARLCEWANEHANASIDIDRPWLRAQASERIATAPPPFQAASDASELRDVSGDADLIG